MSPVSESFGNVKGTKALKSYLLSVILLVSKVAKVDSFIDATAFNAVYKVATTLSGASHADRSLYIS